MGALIPLIVLLIFAIVFFITYPILKRKFVYKNYNVLCSKKIRRIADKKGYKIVSDFNLDFYGENDKKIDNILIGKKYIYIFSYYLFKGDVKGTIDNNSWILEKRGDQGCEYIDNISCDLSEKNRVFSSKINANPELIMPIAIINNDCEIKVNGINNNNTFVVHYSYLKKLIKNLESRDIANLDSELIENQLEIFKNENR